MFKQQLRHRGNFAFKSGGDQWRRQDLVSGGHDDRGAEGASIDAPQAPRGVGYGERCLLPADYTGSGERRKLPQRVRADPRPLSHFLHVLSHRTVLVTRKIRLSRKFHYEKVVVTVTTTFKSGGDDKSPPSPSHTKLLHVQRRRRRRRLTCVVRRHRQTRRI